MKKVVFSQSAFSPYAKKMNYKVLFILLLTNSLKAQENFPGLAKCNIELLDSVESNLNTLDNLMIIRYFNNMGQEFKNNAEFSEWNNEILFKLLDTKPNETCNCLRKVNKDLQLYILSELKQPTNDKININGIITKINQTKCQSKIKKRIIKELIKDKN